MLTGAARAAKTAGGLRLERVWVVAVPVVVVLVLERLCILYWIHWQLVGYFSRNAYAEIAGRAGPMSIRTALVATCFAVTGYALLWAVLAVVEYAREVRRRGRRILVRNGAAGRLLVFSALFLLLAYETTIVRSLPTARELMDVTEADFRAGNWWRFEGAVLHDVPGVRRLCREGLDHPSRPQQLMAALGLTRLGEGNDRTVGLLRSFTLEEFCDPDNALMLHSFEQIAEGVPYLILRARGTTPEQQEQLYLEFRRKHIP